MMKMNVFRFSVLVAMLGSAVFLGGGCRFGDAAEHPHPKSSAAREDVKTAASAMVRIKLVFDGGEAVAVVYDNPTSRDLVAMLPISVQFRDFNNVEKIADPPRPLSKEQAPPGFEPAAGDLAMYAPWGNLSIFYRDFRYSKGLVPIGRFTSGFASLAAMEGDFTVRMEVLAE